MDPGPAHKRRRPAISCTECRRRKTRCDGASPCGACTKSSRRLRCVYHNSNNRNSNHNRKNENATSSTICRIDDGRLDRTQQNASPQLGPDQSILKPEIYDNIQHLDLLSLPLLDNTAASYVDYLDLAGSEAKSMATDLGFPHETCSWSNATTFPPAAFNMLGLNGGEQDQQLRYNSSSHSRFSSGSQFDFNSGLGSAAASTSTSVSASVSPSLYASAPASALELQKLVEPNASEHENHWQDAFAQCEKLRFLLHGTGSNAGDENVPLPPNYETVRPLMEGFTRLDQVAKQERESTAKSSRSLLGWPGSTPLTACTARDLLPPRLTCNVLLEMYIKTFESVLRVLHVPSFLSDYERFWGSSTPRPMEADEAFACKLLVVIAIGSCVSLKIHVPTESERVRRVALRDRASCGIAYSKQWLARKVFEGSRADLDMAQIVCLLALAQHTQHRHATSAGAAWFSGDHDLTRMAIQMGLHREPRGRSPTMSSQEAEIRRRLWATMLELSLQSCLDEGLPAPLSPESYDCEAPSSIADDDLTSSPTNDASAPSAAPDRMTFTPSTVLVLLTRTQRLRLRILQLVNAPGASKAYEDSHQLAAELNAACTVNLDILRSMKKPEPTGFQIKLLDIFTRPFVVALHAPFADQASTKPAYYYSRRIRMEFSALLLAHPLLPAPTSTEGLVSDFDLASTTYQTATASPTLSSKPAAGTSTGWDAYGALHIHGHGHFALVQRQATAALGLDLISELEEDAFPILDGTSRRQLHDALRNAVNVFERRMRVASGTHSTREYLFFACAQAYVDAMLRGCRAHDADNAIAEAARAALTVCCEVLEQRPRPRWIEEDGQMMVVHDSGFANYASLDSQDFGVFGLGFYNPGCT